MTVSAWWKGREMDPGTSRPGFAHLRRWLRIARIPTVTPAPEPGSIPDRLRPPQPFETGPDRLRPSRDPRLDPGSGAGVTKREAAATIGAPPSISIHNRRYETPAPPDARRLPGARVLLSSLTG